MFEILNVSMRRVVIHSIVLVPSSLPESGECGLVSNNHSGCSLWIQVVNATEQYCDRVQVGRSRYRCVCGTFLRLDGSVSCRQISILSKAGGSQYVRMPILLFSMSKMTPRPRKNGSPRTHISCIPLDCQALRMPIFVSTTVPRQ